MEKKGCREAIVVFNGCFCPVHAGHVKALTDTKGKIEADGKTKVIAGYFAVATDGFVRKKVDRLEPWMTADSRVEMCKAVSDDVNWNISAAEFAGWKQCGRAMVAQHHSPETVIIGVRDEAKKGGVSKKGDGETANLSSTGIRAEFARRGCTSEVVNELVCQRVLGRAVGECLKRKLERTAHAASTCTQDGDDLSGGPDLLSGDLASSSVDKRSAEEWGAAAAGQVCAVAAPALQVGEAGAPLAVFAYGTLRGDYNKKGGDRWGLIKRTGATWHSGRTRGFQLYQDQDKCYPFAVQTSCHAHVLVGTLLEWPDAASAAEAIEECDHIEGFDPRWPDDGLYRRATTEVELDGRPGRTRAFVYHQSLPEEGAPRHFSDGDWFEGKPHK